MRADNSHHIVEASYRRRQNTIARARLGLERLLDGDEPVSVARLATEARVSRSWIYTQPGLLDEIRQAQSTSGNGASVHAPEGASAASLLRRLELAHQRNTQLTDANRRLRDQLAHARGQRRAERQTGPTRTRSTTDTTGPRS